MNKATNINPQMLVWARESARLTLMEAAEKLLSSSKKSSATEKLLAIEQGENYPTRKQLFKMAKLYRKPLAIFYLESPPVRSDDCIDFRSPNSPISRRDRALLDSLLTNIGARQSLVRSLVEDEEETPDRDFVNSINLNDNINAVVNHIQKSLEFEGESARITYKTPDKLFNYLRDRTEKLGIFVLLVGNLGSWHSKIEAEVFRGFAIADNVAPFIVINSNDAHTARSFTLLHELCHIFLGSSSISASLEETSDNVALSEIEKYCNTVASEILLPSADLESLDRCNSIEQALKVIEYLAENYRVSESSVTYKLLIMDKIDRKIASSLFGHYKKCWGQQREIQKIRNKNVVVNNYDIKRKQLGKSLIRLVNRNLRDTQLTNTKAAIILGTRPTSVDALLHIG